MSGSTDNRASRAAENPPDRSKVFDLSLARRMLPLVLRIADDLILAEKQITGLLPEQEQLDRQRRTLAWPERCRRYRLREEIAACEKSGLQAIEELESLGLVLLDVDGARIGFPTLVNNRRAYFSWRSGENDLQSWHFAGENLRRPVPASWTTMQDSRRAVKS